MNKMLASDKQQFNEISNLIMNHLDGKCMDVSMLKQLEKLLGRGHDSNCVIDAVPACSCGLSEAQQYLQLMRQLQLI